MTEYTMATRVVCMALVAWIGGAASVIGAEPRVFRAGAAAIDITPTSFPVIVNGYFNERIADRALDRVMARAIVLDDGATRLAILVADNLMVPQEILDQAKDLAHQATGIPIDRMLMSATHTHSAPSAMACLGSGADLAYQQFLPGQLAKAVAQAAENLVAAKIGWTVIQDHEHNHCRRWVFRADRMNADPFGVRNVRAHMHPGHQSPNHIGPSGPADPDLSILSLQTTDGRPMAVLANYAMHYYGMSPVSGDFCGRFGGVLGDLIGAADSNPPFVGIMSQGTSGDSMWPDFSKPAGKNDIDAYTAGVAGIAKSAYDRIAYQDWVPLAMAERTLRVRRRVPNDERLAWARATMATLEGRTPQSLPEIYAREQIHVHDEPEVDVKLQAIRIGELGITAIPNEVYGITGLKLKSASPLPTTFNIELANGAQGYIPPPEQHALGGYTTWAARTAGLEVEAEPRIVATLLELLEEVAGKPRRPFSNPRGDYCEAVTGSKPVAYWRLDELAGTEAHDALGARHAAYEPGVALFLPGPEGNGFSNEGRGNRGAHFAGGRLRAHIPDLPNSYSAEFWFWNGLPHDASAVTGYLFSRGTDGDMSAAGDHVGIGGTYRGDLTGKLIFFNGNQLDQVLAGTTEIALKTWNHVVLTRSGKQVRVYLNGATQPEIAGEAEQGFADGVTELFLGGRNDNLFGLEGKMDEVAIYDRVLEPAEITAHVTAAGGAAPPPASPTTASAPHADPPPRSPAESLAMHHVRDGFVVELVAAEPLVVDPVAIAWGADGKLWVAEMADYPSGMDGDGKPGGRVRYLQDTNADGTYDKSTLFLDGISFPTGVLPWRQGVLVTAAPEIFYAEDRDGDGKADFRETIYSGFFEGNQQLRVNGLQLGLDNWVHCALGSHHLGYAAETKIRSAKTGAETHVGGRDFRIRPNEGMIDPLAGPSQFGRNQDNWGNWFGEQNSYPLWHYVLEDYYTRRNPHVAPPDPRRQLLLPANPKVYPFTAEKRFHSFGESGHFTSACSAMIYRDELLFGGGESQHSFTCEPFHNLVHHGVLSDEGVSFHAERAAEEQTSEFFASADRWCRPVMTRTGPDGALWIVDMYRYMIEHPQWLPKQGQEELKPFFRAGDDRGRLYRIYPQGQTPRPIPRLDGLSSEELVARLESPSGWQRDIAQQLLVERNDPRAVAPLELLAARSERATARLHALCALEGLGVLKVEQIQRALGDSHPGVRRHAVRLSEPLAAREPRTKPILLDAIMPLASDADAKVRLQVACSLGEWEDPRIGQILAQIAVSDSHDTHIVAAVMSSLDKSNIGGSLAAAIEACREGRDSGILAGRLLALAVDLEHGEAIRSAMNDVSRQPGGKLAEWQYAAAANMLDAVARHNAARASWMNAHLSAQISAMILAARKQVVDAGAEPGLRVAAARMLVRNDGQRLEDLEILGSLLTPQTVVPIQEGVVAHLSSQRGRDVAEVMIANWKGYGPPMRSRVLSVLASRKEWVEILLEQMESGDVVSAEIDIAARQQLATRKEPDLQARLEKQLALASTADRQEVLVKFADSLTIAGDPGRGATQFDAKCAKCHKLGDRGHEVGPNLVSLTDKSPKALLTAILDPSQAVEPKFLNYTVVTVDGLTYTGMLASETGNSITLLAAEGKQQVILRTEVELLQSTGKSMMPDGLEKDLTARECADVMAFIAGATSPSASSP